MTDIKQRISLDGDEDVAAKLRKIGDTGQDAFRKLKESSGATLPTLGQRVGEGLEGGHEVGEKLRETLHGLHPVLEEAGLGISGLGSFARLARGNLEVLGAAVAGTLLIGLAKLGDETQKSKERLKALGDESGFEKLTGHAKSLGTEVGNLQPRYEKFLQLQQRANAQNRSVIHPPGFEPGGIEQAASGVRVIGGSAATNTPAPRESFQNFDHALFETIRRDVTSAEQAGKIAEEFETSLAKGGLSADALRSLQQQAPHAANFVTGSLSQVLGRGFANPNDLAEAIDRGQVKVGATDLINEAAKRRPEADAAAQSARGVSEAFEGLEASTKRLAEALAGGGDNIVKAIDGISHRIDDAADHFDHLAHPNDFLPGGSKFIGPVRPEDIPHAPQSLGEVFTSNQGDLLGRIVGYLRSGAQSPAFGGGNPFGVVTDFLGNAATNPAALQEKPRPAGEPLFPPGFVPDRTRGDLLIAPPQAEQHSELQGLPAEIGAAFRESTADLSGASKEQTGILQQIAAGIAALAGVLAGQKSTTVEGPVEIAGVRGGGGGFVALDSGGKVSGPGTSTSDSVPALLSDGEFVVKASSVQKAGLGFMHWLNAGKFADGGAVTGLSVGNHQITYDPITGGAYIDGNLHMPGDPLLNDPVVKAQIEQSKAGMAESEHSKPKHKSDFVGIFGGHVFDEPGSYAGGGLIGHFAGGGGIDLATMFAPAPSSPLLSDAALSSLAPSSLSPFGDVPHYGTTDLRTDHGDLRVLGTDHLIKQLSRGASDRAMVRTGISPSWRHGT